jgi:hypothetical protein
MVMMRATLLVLLGFAVGGAVDRPTPVRLADLLANPNRYDGTLVEVSADFHSALESYQYLVGPRFQESRSFDDLVLLSFSEPLSRSAKSDMERLDRAVRQRRFVRVTVVGWFRVCTGPCVPEAAPTFRFKLAVSKVVRIEGSNTPFDAAGRL